MYQNLLDIRNSYSKSQECFIISEYNQPREGDWADRIWVVQNSRLVSTISDILEDRIAKRTSEAGW